MSTLGSQINYSHQTVYKALTGPNMPSRAVTEALGKALGGEESMRQVLVLWEDAVDEERDDRPEESDSGQKNPDDSLSPAHMGLVIALRTLQQRAPVWKLSRYAEQAGMARSTAYSILSGRHLPSWQPLQRLIVQLGGDPDEFHRQWEAAFRERQAKRLSRRSTVARQTDSR
ncbi:hypothetical protein Sme01_19090 [Sphaerisporangium melleum]|uniref:HTH cro/C1-type domain-containing protein n=1 Tax=Sphaerisporangium melleum TaxID=321316 RepID=A0A917RDL6_9ACTN|nr:hypothetical protein GCM10007964_51560 [Sphaerisporangium melleum]GII69433.1 hypothetical protein Sme01_19090 [Sphaerisporangium melleum]